MARTVYHPDRPAVVDLAYGGLTSSTVPGAVLTDVTALLEAVDSPTIPSGGGRMYTRHAWRGVFERLGLTVHPGRLTSGLVVGHPSTWGPRRASVLAEVGGRPGAVSLVPRAVLIARSHSDVTMSRCAVVETTRVPRRPRDPTDRTPDRWSVQIMRRAADGWRVERSTVLPADDDADTVVKAIDDSVEAVFVDGADRAGIRRAVDLVSQHAVAGRVVRVDRRLILRYGWRVGETSSDVFTTTASEESSAWPESAKPRRSRIVWTAVAAVVAVAIAVTAVVIGVVGKRDDPVPASEQVAVGRTTLTVPGQWRRSEQATPSGASADPGTTRTVFVDPDDGRRLILVQTRVRDDSTQASVAASLRNRLGQRGDDVVTEFSPSTRFAGRDVISYREAPASGSAIRWYVLVDHALQVSIGCQPGTGAEPVDVECEQAVRTAGVAPG